jgi:hypothetical protein
VATALKERFGRVAAVAERHSEAMAFRDARVESFLLGGSGEPPPGVSSVSSWSALAQRLLERMKDDR